MKILTHRFFAFTFSSPDQVGSLKEELEKECMYVEYLERLLNDIELRR